MRPEALAALVDYDPDADLDANVDGDDRGRRRACARGEVTQAVRDAVAECGPDREGDWIAFDARRHLRRDDVGAPADAVCALLDELVDDDSEIVTVLVGVDAPRGRDRSASASTSSSRIPHVEVEFHDGGQPLYPYLVGVE